MTARSRTPFAGRLETGGFVVDVDHVGPVEAHRRIARAWVRGTVLRTTGSRLVVCLPEPVSVRAEKSPGLPLVPSGTGWAVPHPGGHHEPVTGLPPADLADVVDIDGLELVELAPAPGVPVPVPGIDRPEPDRPRPSLRSRAAVGALDPRAAARAARMVEEMSRSGRGRNRGRGGGQGGQATGSGLVARWASRRPMTPTLRRRHARYLDRLTADFERRNWEDALRSAIALGGSGQGFASLRLPGRRAGALRPSTTRGGAGAQIPYGDTVEQHLRALYRSAADQLEAAGDHLRAAFVHADLLDNLAAAIDVLERHGLHREAAELAEAREADPAWVVRLWWRAGDRRRALAVAVSRGAFADAVSRLEQLDKGAAVDLRREWMLDRRRAGDHAGALAAAWPAEVLRDETVPDVAAGIAAGGTVASVALAHWLEHAPTDEALSTAREILSDAPEHATARRALVEALAEHPVGEESWDRELSSAALVVMARGGGPVASRNHHDVSARLQRRADPLLVADLPRLRAGAVGQHDPAHLDLTDRGSLEVHDAVAVGTGSVLVALGELGARLLTLDGRTRATWDVPTHRLVVADHGTRVLLVTDRAPRFAVHQLDLPNGRPVELPSLDVMPFESYDGARPLLVSGRGMEWVTARDGRWSLVWRELTDPGDVVRLVSRAADSLAAVVTTQGRLETWRWDLPSHALRGRGGIEPAQLMAVTATGEVGRFHSESGVATLDWHSVHGHRLTTETLFPEGEPQLLTSASGFARTDHGTGGTYVTIHPTYASTEVATLALPDGVRPLFRIAGGRVTTGHSGGRVVVIDPSDNRIGADITLRA